MVVLGGALATFFLSLLRLHRQTVEAKASELANARELGGAVARQAPPKKA